MRRPLFQLSPGTQFYQADLGITGTLISVNDCRARVRIYQSLQEVEFIGPGGQPRSFRASRNCESSWASTVVVEALSVDAPDAFVGAFAAAIDAGADLPAALRYGSAAGGLACLVRGAQSSLPTKAMIDARLGELQPAKALEG